MAAPKKTRKLIRVEFDDASVATFNPNRPNLLIAFELEHGEQQPKTHTQLAWLAWHALGRDGKFETWLDTVASIDTTEVEMGKA
jgi:hypothetical protein